MHKHLAVVKSYVNLKLALCQITIFFTILGGYCG